MGDVSNTELCRIFLNARKVRLENENLQAKEKYYNMYHNVLQKAQSLKECLEVLDMLRVAGVSVSEYHTSNISPRCISNGVYLVVSKGSKIMEISIKGGKVDIGGGLCESRKFTTSSYESATDTLSYADTYIKAYLNFFDDKFRKSVANELMLIGEEVEE